MELEYWIAVLVPVIILLCINPKLRRAVNCYGKYFVFFVYFTFVSCLVIPLCLKNPAQSKSIWTFALLLPPISGMLGINWEHRGLQKMIRNDKSSVCIANHQSMYDILGMLIILRRQSLRCGIIARNFFFWLWPVGLAMWMAGVVFIKRQSGLEKTKQAFNEATQRIFKNKDKLWVFVEGTRKQHSSDSLLPFKKGAFITAVDNQVPLQPIIYSPFYFLDIKNKIFDSGKVIVEIMDPIPTKGLTRDDVDDLVAKTHALMSNKYNELLNELKPEIERYRNSRR